MAVLGAATMAASGAFACANISTLSLSPSHGTAGARVTVTGTSYSLNPPVLPVVVRWNGTEGPELARVTPNAKGEINVAITIPAAVPGYYVVVAMQRDARGVDRYGTPSRAAYQVLSDGQAAPPATTVISPTTVRPPAAPSTTVRPATSLPPAATVGSTTVVPTDPVAATGRGGGRAPVLGAVAGGVTVLAGTVGALLTVRRRRHSSGR